MSTFLPRKSSPKALKVDVHLVKCTALGFLLACYLAYPSIRPRRRPSETFHEIANMSEDGDHVGRQGATSESTDNKMFSAIYGIRMKPDSRDGRIRPCLKYTDKDRQMHQYVRAHLEFVNSFISARDSHKQDIYLNRRMDIRLNVLNDGAKDERRDGRMQI